MRRAHAILRRREGDAVVDPDGIGGVVGLDDAHRSAVPHRHGDDVGQVLLAGGRRRDPVERAAQPSRVERVGAHVDLAHGARDLVGVGLLHDRCRSAVEAHDPAIAGGVGEVGGDEHDGRVTDLPLVEDGAEEGPGLERRVAHGDQDGLRLGRNQPHAGPHRVGGPHLRLLARGCGASADGRLDGIGAMAGDDDRVGDTGIGQRIEDMVDQGATGERMQHLGKAGTHASPLAGGQDDGRGGGQMCRHVRGW